MTVRPGNTRTRPETGGWTLYDIGVYCINAARYLFGAEPNEVMAMSVNGGGTKLAGVDETTAAILRFDRDRVASFQALYESAQSGRAVRVPPFRKLVRPSGRQRIVRPGVRKPKLVKVQSASVN